MNRGTDRCPIFLDPETDRALFKETLAQAVARWEIRIHAYALMGNHYHLLVDTPLGNLSRAMRHIDGIYTQRFNRVYGRDGPLMRGRYKAILVEKDAYFLELVRYIHLNGVRAGLYASPEADPHCSHRDYLYPSKAPRWLEQRTVLSCFESGRHDRAVALDCFVKQGLPRPIEDVFNKRRWPPILGSKDFIERVRSERVDLLTPHLDVPQRRQLAQEVRPAATAVLERVLSEFGWARDDLTALRWREHREMRWITAYFLRHACHLEYRKIGELLGGLSYAAIERFLSRNNFEQSLHFKVLQDDILGADRLMLHVKT